MKFIGTHKEYDLIDAETPSAWVKTTQRYAHLSQDTLLAAANSATTALGAAMMPRVLPVALAA